MHIECQALLWTLLIHLKLTTAFEVGAVITNKEVEIQVSDLFINTAAKFSSRDWNPVLVGLLWVLNKKNPCKAFIIGSDIEYNKCQLNICAHLCNYVYIQRSDRMPSVPKLLVIGGWLEILPFRGIKDNQKFVFEPYCASLGHSPVFLSCSPAFYDSSLIFLLILWMFHNSFCTLHATK